VIGRALALACGLALSGCWHDSAPSDSIPATGTFLQEMLPTVDDDRFRAAFDNALALLRAEGPVSAVRRTGR